MPYFKSSQEWLDQTILLLDARPSTTRITAKHTIKPVKSSSNSSGNDGPKPPRARIILKTFDPQSGVCLKYKTNKAAEVGRLMGASLGRAGRGMSGLGEEQSDVKAAEGDGEGQKSEAAAVQSGTTASHGVQGGGGGSAGKKKKGRK